MNCHYCTGTAGYLVHCAQAKVAACKRHLGAVCAIFLYDNDAGSVIVTKQAISDQLSPTKDAPR